MKRIICVNIVDGGLVMKRVVSIFLSFIMMIVIPVTVAESHDFKSFNWGENMSAVEEVLGAPSSKKIMNEINSTVLVYETNALGIDVTMDLYFFENQFYSARYYVSDNYEDFVEITTCYETFKTALREKYGIPTSDTLEEHGSDAMLKRTDGRILQRAAPLQASP